MLPQGLLQVFCSDLLPALMTTGAEADASFGMPPRTAALVGSDPLLPAADTGQGPANGWQSCWEKGKEEYSRSSPSLSPLPLG